MTQKIISHPPTPEYEASYERVFGKKTEWVEVPFDSKHFVTAWNPFPEFTATRQECVDAFKKSRGMK